ncbi:hypothetical protein B0H66DRAFT_542282 [Apodospora peruviana]|uniref:AA1-like domain-containing protein n=1 Tax=Apodospora peruviana TaxID=516989 RepID=A0AAE0MG91_9PEZI|nr:hypothetical protein B0H66DRAFT_542282 [Apodospora peruviana]
MVAITLLHLLGLLLATITPLVYAMPSIFSRNKNSPLQRKDTLNEAAKSSTCAETSFDSLSWTAQDFWFRSSVIFSTPAHRAVADGEVSFNLTNTALDYTQSCYARSLSPTDFFYGNEWYTCDEPFPTGTNITGAPNITVPAFAMAVFRFDRSAGKLDVNQTWACLGDDLDGGRDSIFFNASGTANISLQCDSQRWQNPDWKMGQLYSTDTVDCAAKNVTIFPFQIQAWEGLGGVSI